MQSQEFRTSDDPQNHFTRFSIFRERCNTDKSQRSRQIICLSDRGWQIQTLSFRGGVRGLRRACWSRQPSTSENTSPSLFVHCKASLAPMSQVRMAVNFVVGAVFAAIMCTHCGDSWTAPELALCA
mmetsp:Transcript_19508/g.30970  ORF Transcript_19508/g.30970 Transcript_19508/m.30970 type:complete len:126 (-) Transcript_19508:139-516(-)